jgi:hypothetical protein
METDARLIAEKYEALDDLLDERVRRVWAATEARALGYGGVSLIARATGLSRATIAAGLDELRQAPRPAPVGPPIARRHRVREPGAGRKRLVAQHPTLTAALDALVEPTTRGDPESPLRWTCKSVRVLAAELAHQGYRLSHQKVSELLRDADYSLQANRKTREGNGHPDRNAQFEHIAAQTRAFQQRGQPVISVDTKKKELVGDFKNPGREWQPKGTPERVRVHDFLDPALGKVIPYGVYDIGANAGWVSVGVDHDTPEFAVESIRHWWQRMGRKTYPNATELLITADGGGSNSSRARLWKVALQGLADGTGVRISVCHFPPGTSKWNKIEHRMFCHITENWRGRPLISHEVIVKLIAKTTTTAGLRIRAGLDRRQYRTGTPVAKATMAGLQVERDAFHGDWNYTLVPRATARAAT